LSEKTDLNTLGIEGEKIDVAKSDDAELLLIDQIVQDYAPEIAQIYDIREDEAEEQQIKTGRLHENRILGIILKFYLEGKKKITTAEVEQEYKRYYKEIARSTISTYLNMLKKESTLYKERDGRLVYYIFYEDPPKNIKPFWFTRIFCIVPAYFERAIIFSRIYSNSKQYVMQYIKELNYIDKETLEKNFKFLTGLTILNIFKNRSEKCIFCQFSKREIYNKLKEEIEIAIKDRADVLPEELLDTLVNKYSEIPIFKGIPIESDEAEIRIAKNLIKFADNYKKDLEFQIMVSSRRKDIRLKQKELKESQESN
jgi:hypothetical protein